MRPWEDRQDTKGDLPQGTMEPEPALRTLADSAATRSSPEARTSLDVAGPAFGCGSRLCPYLLDALRSLGASRYGGVAIARSAVVAVGLTNSMSVARISVTTVLFPP